MPFPVIGNRPSRTEEEEHQEKEMLRGSAFHPLERVRTQWGALAGKGNGTASRPARVCEKGGRHEQMIGGKLFDYSSCPVY